MPPEPSPPQVLLPPPGPRSRPSDPPLDPLPAGPEQDPTTDPASPPRRRLPGLTGPRTADTTGTPPPATDSTSGDQPRPRGFHWPWKGSGDPEKVAAVISGLLILAVGGVAGAVARSGKRRLRRPTTAQAEAMGVPLAGIACRHLPMALLSDDLQDLGRFGAAFQAYAEGGPDDGPLLTRTDVLTGVTP